MTTYYKIRHKKTGLYSKGGAFPRWSKSGKTWQSLGLLRQHISMILGSYVGNDIGDWEVIPMHVVEGEPIRVDEIMSNKQLLRVLSK